MKGEHEIKVGSKSKSEYVSAVLYCLDNFNSAVLKGLGRKQSKVLEIQEMAAKIDGVCIDSIESIEVNDSKGLKVEIVKEEE